MLKHFLIPLDGSRLAESVLPYATYFAHACGARVTLLHVIERSPVDTVHGDHHIRDAAEAKTYLDGIRARFPNDIAVECHVHTDPERRVAASITAHQHEFGHDLVIMCSHGAGGLRSIISGSIAQQVVATGTLPLLYIRPEYSASVTEYCCRSILVPLDGDPAHEPGFHAAAQAARALHAALHLVTVVRTWDVLADGHAALSRLMPASSVRMLDLMAEEAENYLRKQAETQPTLPSALHVLRGDPSRAILELAQQLGTDLLVIGTHGRKGVDAFWAGTVTPRILERARRPVLLIPVKETPHPR